MRPGALIAWIAIGGAVAFAVQGGEYSTSDLRQLRREQAEEARRVTELERLVDSLERAAVAIEQDPAVQERAARELFGMIRRGEFLYKLVSSEASGAEDAAP